MIQNKIEKKKLKKKKEPNGGIYIVVCTVQQLPIIFIRKCYTTKKLVTNILTEHSQQEGPLLFENIIFMWVP